MNGTRVLMTPDELVRAIQECSEISGKLDEAYSKLISSGMELPPTIYSTQDKQRLTSRLLRVYREVNETDRVLMQLLPESKYTQLLQQLEKEIGPKKVAREIGVTRQTIHSWRQTNSKSGLDYARKRQILHASLINIPEKAIEILYSTEKNIK